MPRTIGRSYLEKDFQKEYWEYHANAHRFDHPVVRFFANQRIDYVARFIPFTSVKSAFDVGCGDGFSTYYMNQRIPLVEGGDISELMLSRNPLPRSRLLLIDAEKLPLSDDAYDLVYTWEVLHHLPHPERAVQEMARVSRHYVVIFEPNRDHPLHLLSGLLRKHERGTLRSTKVYLEKLCRQAGLRIVASCHCGKIFPNRTPTWLLPILQKLSFASRRLTGISILVIAEKKR